MAASGRRHTTSWCGSSDPRMRDCRAPPAMRRHLQRSAVVRCARESVGFGKRRQESVARAVRAISRMRSCRRGPLQPEQLSSSELSNFGRVFATLLDRERNVWVGTDNGLHRFSRSNVVRGVVPRCFQYGFTAAGFAPGADGALWLACGDPSGARVDEIRDGKVVSSQSLGAVHCCLSRFRRHRVVCRSFFAGTSGTGPAGQHAAARGSAGPSHCRAGARTQRRHVAFHHAPQPVPLPRRCLVRIRWPGRATARLAHRCDHGRQRGAVVWLLEQPGGPGRGPRRASVRRGTGPAGR